MATSGSGTGTPISTGSAGSGQGLGYLQPLPRTLLPLARYAQIMLIQQPHFHQMAGPLAPLTGGCEKVWDQQARSELAWTMMQAEEMIANELGYWPAPKFITDELLPIGLNGVRYDWWNSELDTKWGYVEGYGTEQLTLLEADASVTYQDLDGDPFGRPETASIGSSLYSTLSACGDACEVAVFFRVADGAEDAAHPSWEIRPVKVDIDGSTMTIKAEASQFVKPELWALTEADCEGSDDTTAWMWNFDTDNLVSRVDVYCRTINPQTPVTLRWDGACGCSTGYCSHETQSGCAQPTNTRLGFFRPRPATWNGSTHVEAIPLWSSPPESALVNYRSGHALDSRCQMNQQLERAIVKLTNVLLPRQPCNYCDAAQIRWQQDRAPVDPLTPEAASLPWDMYSQGALEAWRIIKRIALGRGGKMGR